MDAGGVYGQWAGWLAGFADAREPVSLQSLPRASSAELGSLATARLCERCVDAMQQRLRRCNESFSRDLDGVRSGEELRAALSAARRRLMPLQALAETPLLFDELRIHLRDELQRALAEMQADLERSARTAGVQREIMLRAVLEQPLDRPLAPVSLQDLQDEPGVGEQTGAHTARRIVTG